METVVAILLFLLLVEVAALKGAVNRHRQRMQDEGKKVEVAGCLLRAEIASLGALVRSVAVRRELS